jgi:hypothetical protein
MEHVIMRLLLSTAIAALFIAASANAQVLGTSRVPQVVGTLQAAPQPPAPISYGPAQCALHAFTPAQGWTPVRHPRFFADVNADNRDDIVGFADDGVWVSLSTGAGFQNPERWIADFGYANGWRQDIHERTLADVSGDGRADIVGFGNEGTYIALSTGSAFGPTQRWAEDFGAQQAWRKLSVTVAEGDGTAHVGVHHQRMAADINNNGRADIIGFGNTGTYFAISTGNRFTGTRLAVSDLGFEQGWRVFQESFGVGSGPIPSNRIRTMADVNGDGNADIVAFGEDGVYTAISRSIRFDPLERRLTVLDGDDTWSGSDFRVLGDLDGDGRADVVGIQRGGGIAAFGNASGGFDLAPFFVIDGMGTDTGWRNNETHPRMLVDLNGDNRTDFVGFGDDGVWTALAQGRGPMTSPVFTIAAFGRNDPQWRTANMRFTPDLNADNRADFAGFGADCVWIALSPGANPVAPPLGSVRERVRN